MSELRNMSRSGQVTKNMLAGFVGQIVTIVLGFTTRTVFIYTLTAAYLGISGLFTSVLTVLNLSELGIGVSITYALYKPLLEADEEKIKSLMRLYARAYRIIGCAILVLGISLLPFLDYIISGDSQLTDIRIVYMLYIAESVASYWLFAYKQTLLEANQKKYIVTVYNMGVNVAVSAAKIISLLLLKNNPELSFYFFTAIGIAGQLINNVLIGREADKLFPYLKDKDAKKLTKEEIRPIFKNVVGVFVSKISGIMITSVDNILISAFINISTVGIYSNYLLLRKYITKPIGIIFDSLTASIGDFCAGESIERQEEFFHTIQFAYFWIYGFCSISLWILINPFIGGVWLNDEYLLSDLAVTMIALNFLLDGLSGAVIKFRVAHGLYWQAKFRYLFSAIMNGVISFILVKPLGVEGVLFGTTASVLVMLLFDPIIVYKNVFNKSPKKYYILYIKYILIVFATGAIVSLACLPFKEMTVLNFIIKLLICAIVTNVIWYLMFRKNKDMKYLTQYAGKVKNHIEKIVQMKGSKT